MRRDCSGSEDVSIWTIWLSRLRFFCASRKKNKSYDNEIPRIRITYHIIVSRELFLDFVLILQLLFWAEPIMPCFSNFCCGYGLRSGGSFIGYFSIVVYVKLFILCVIFLYCIRARIDDSEGLDGFSFVKQFSNLLKVRSSNYEIESSLKELKGEI